MINFENRMLQIFLNIMSSRYWLLSILRRPYTHLKLEIRRDTSILDITATSE